MKKLLILLLSLCFVVGGVAFTACAPQGDVSSDSSQETSSSESVEEESSSSEQDIEMSGTTIPY